MTNFSSKFLIVILITLFLGCSSLTKAPTYNDRLSILQGYTTDSTSQFSIVSAKNRNFLFAYRSLENNELTPITNQQILGSTTSQYVVHKILVNQLKLKVTYQLEVYENDELIDQREFQTLDFNKKQPTLVVASCMSDQDNVASARDKIWQEITATHQPDLIFLIGDTSYADAYVGGGKHLAYATPQNLWDRYTETRFKVPLYSLKKLYPIVAVWDDHDYGKNNGGIEYKFKNEAKTIFNTFFAQDEDNGLVKGPGVSFTIKAFNQQFIFLDNRSFRTENFADLVDQTHWGKKQETWLLSLLNSTTQPSWLINGDQIWADYHKFESYKTNHPKNFQKIIKQVGSAKSPVAFLSGDRHLTELILPPKTEFPYQTIELTTSGVHAKLYPKPDTNLPRGVIERNSSDYNYAVIKSRTRGKELIIDLKTFGLGKKLLFKKIISVKKSG